MGNIPSSYSASCGPIEEKKKEAKEASEALLTQLGELNRAKQKEKEKAGKMQAAVVVPGSQEPAQT